MKKILITGAESYIGTSFEKYITENFTDKYEVDSIDMVDGSWREKSFCGYSTVFHVAGIAHSDYGIITSEEEELYRSVNTALAIETATKAKAEGVKQFIFMSSAIIYGDSAPIGKEKIITRNSLPAPSNCYANSKLQAENGILPLNDDKFRVCILRSPMIYGKGSKGNFHSLEKIANMLPIFPMVNNRRSMLYVGNLVEFVRLLIENDEQGLFWPQNAEYSNTSELIKLIAEANGNKVVLVPGFSWLLKLLSHFTPLIDKAFGNLCYEQDLSIYKERYQIFTLKDSIKDIKYGS